MRRATHSLSGRRWRRTGPVLRSLGGNPVSEEGSVWKCRSCGAAWDEAPTDTTFWCPSCGAWDVHGKVVMDLACTCQMVVGSYSPPGGLPGTICPCDISANCRFTRSEAYALRELSPMKE